MTVLVVVTVSDIIRKRTEHKSKASQNEQARLQADINALKKSIGDEGISHRPLHSAA